MSEISEIIGDRIRNHRNRLELTQEELAERCGLHATYIGQLERGEKNATLDSIERVISGLDISFEILFENLTAKEYRKTPASLCYSIVDSLREEEQAVILSILESIVKYKKI